MSTADSICRNCGMTLAQHHSPPLAPHLPPPAQGRCVGFAAAVKEHSDERATVRARELVSAPGVTFPDRTIYDEAGGVYYVPFLADDGRIGYIVRVTATGEQETHIYLNPSQSEGDGDANVFVYMGGENDPAVDLPLHHYRTDPRLEDSPGDTAR